ncbi:MAG TPA: fatty acyl-AMP ligase [Mycobacteriales bacterium]|nr:fatty acyl-AMP ligase [Mycobacteriales bacterium]
MMKTDLASRAASLTEVLREHARTQGSRPALTFSSDAFDATADVSLTYAELDARAARIAALLGQRFALGDRILLLHAAGLEFAQSFLGCLYAGMIAVPSPLPDGYKRQQDRLAGIAHDSGAVAVLTDTAHLPAVTEWARDAGLDGLAVIDVTTATLPAESEFSESVTTRDTIAFLQYTSGSTSSPKGVCVDHGNLLANVQVFAEVTGIGPDTVFGGWLPTYHDFGLIGQLIVPLTLGLRSVLMAPMEFLKRPHSWLHLIDRAGINVSPAPNFGYDLCVRRITEKQCEGLDLSRWTHALNGSEPINARTVTEFATTFAAYGLPRESVLPGYGMAEATLAVSCSDPNGGPFIQAVNADRFEHHALEPADEPGARAVVSSGRVSDRLDLRIVNPHTRQALRPGQIGEIWLRGSSIARGYWQDEEMTAKTFGARTAEGEGGFLRTGDLGAYLGGELFVTGRIKELLIVHGRNLYPQDLEAEARAAHPALSRGVSAVFTVEVPQEEIVAICECRAAGLDETQVAEVQKAITHAIRRGFGVGDCSVVLVRPGSVPRTTSGKIQRRLARELFLSGAFAGGHAALIPSVQRAVDSATAVAVHDES